MRKGVLIFGDLSIIIKKNEINIEIIFIIL
jgi:hypothetical protein